MPKQSPKIFVRNSRINTLKKAIEENNRKTKENLCSGSYSRITAGYPLLGGITVISGKKILGWGAAWDDGEFHIYIIPKQRRKRIGSIILEKARKMFPKHSFCPHDMVSRSFFSGCGTPVHPNWIHHNPDIYKSYEPKYLEIRKN